MFIVLGMLGAAVHWYTTGNFNDIQVQHDILMAVVGTLMLEIHELQG